MSGTHHQLLYHLVFSTKNRMPYLQPETRENVFEYLGGTVNGLGGVSLRVGGWIDHVHLLVKLTTQHRLSDFMRELKSSTSKHINDTSGLIQKFGWQDGYGAFTVSKSQLPKVASYIDNQEERHYKMTFQEEYLGFLRFNEIEFDPRFIWN
jgi:putative transposase